MGDFFMEIVPFLVISVVSVTIVCGICGKYIDAKVGDDTTTGNMFRDRLNELPDEVLSYLLSFLSLRDVARMATLSRNLRKACLDYRHLDLDWWELSGGKPGRCHFKDYEPYRQAFVKRVDQVLRYYRDRNIISFRLSCCLDNRYTAVDRWISFAAANMYLQSLTLQFACKGSGRICYFNQILESVHRVSGSFLTQLPYLKDLHLSSCILKLGIDFRLSNLTTLDLYDIVLDGIQWNDFLSMSSSTIECLRLESCNVPNKMHIDDNFERLSSLLIGDCFALKELRLSARNLKTFEFWSPFLKYLECSFSSVPKLESVIISVYPYLECESRGFFDNLAANVPSLKHLILRGIDHLAPSRPGLFWPVLSVRISIHFDNGNILELLPLFLHLFPLLKKLELSLPDLSKKRHGYELSDLPVLFPHTNLKEITLTHFRLEWIPVAAYLLKIATVLDRIELSKSRQKLIGCESWVWHTTGDLLSKKEHKIIRTVLVGQASSTNVEMVIK